METTLFGLEPYQQFDATDLPDPKTVPITVVTARLAEIVEVEGPVTVRTLLDRYRVGAGYGKLVGPTREVLTQAIDTAIFSRRIVVLSKDEDDPYGNVVAMPSSPRVRLRERGPRDLLDIPLEEIAALAVNLGISPEPEEIAFTEVLKAYGLVRKTELAKDRLRRALALASQVVHPDVVHAPAPAHETPAPAVPLVPQPLISQPLLDNNGDIYRLRVYDGSGQLVLWAGVAVARETEGEAIRWTIRAEGETETTDYLCPPMAVKRLKVEG